MDHHRGGFHGYRKQQQQQHPKPTSAPAPPATDHHQMNNHVNGGRSMLGVPAVELMNHTACNNNHNNNNNVNNMNGNSSSNINNNNSSTDVHHLHQDMNNNECTVREQDRFMPIANVIRIMRKILPPHAKISDDAKETIQECVSEYISFITGEANERCQREQRKTITAEDVLWAMSKLGFDDYIEPLTLYLHRYRELEGDRGSIRTCEPLLKMGRAAAMDHYAAAFGPPVFHIGPPGPPHHHHHHHHSHHPGPAGAYFLGPPSSSVNGYLQHNNKDCNSAACCTSDAAPSSSDPAAAAPTSLSSFEPYANAQTK